jgi:hypothetical protein
VASGPNRAARRREHQVLAEVGLLGLRIFEACGSNIAARHADPRTTMRHDRPHRNLDRHPNYILAAYLGSGHDLAAVLIRPCRWADFVAWR